MTWHRRAMIFPMLLLLLLVYLSPMMGRADGPSAKKVYVLNQNASLWPEKKTTGKPIQRNVGIEYVVTVLSQEGEWTKVELLDGSQGYMHTYYLGGLYMIYANEKVYALREKGGDRTRYNSVAFDRKGENLLVLWEEEDWVYVIELRNGIGGYIPRNQGYEIVQYP